MYLPHRFFFFLVGEGRGKSYLERVEPQKDNIVSTTFVSMLDYVNHINYLILVDTPVVKF